MSNNENKDYLKILEEAQKNNPKLVLPSMGLIDNNKRIDINGKDYLNSIKEDNNVK